MLFETVLSHMPCKIQHVLSTVCSHMNQKAHMACNFNHFSETKDCKFVNVVISQKQCQIVVTIVRKYFD